MREDWTYLISLYMSNLLILKEAKMTEKQKQTKTYVVYKHTNKVNGKIYIGITGKKVPKYRWGRGSGYHNNIHFVNAIKKYGWDNFEHEILETGLTCKEAKEREQFWIAKYNCNNPKFGYNKTKGGDSAPNSDVCEVIRQSKLGSKNPNAKRVYSILDDKEFSCVRECAEYYQMNNKTLEQYCRGNRRCRQFIYVDDYNKLSINGKNNLKSQLLDFLKQEEQKNNLKQRKRCLKYLKKTYKEIEQMIRQDVEILKQCSSSNDSTETENISKISKSTKIYLSKSVVNLIDFTVYLNAKKCAELTSFSYRQILDSCNKKRAINQFMYKDEFDLLSQKKQQNLSETIQEQIRQYKEKGLKYLIELKSGKPFQIWNKGKKCPQISGENNGIFHIKPENHPRAKKVIRLSDKTVYGTIKECWMDNNIIEDTVRNHCTGKVKNQKFMFLKDYIKLYGDSSIIS